MKPDQFNPPLIAILRGLAPEQAESIGRALFDAGFRLLEVPLNRPGALESIRILASIKPADAIVGGGTMLNVQHVNDVYEAGGRLLVSPNYNPEVIRRGVELGMLVAPGVATPSEAFNALEAGAHALKFFPAEMVGHGGLKASKTVLPPGTPLWPVGGITPDNIGGWVKAGATGFGIGSQLYAPGVDAATVGERARAYIAAWQAANAA